MAKLYFKVGSDWEEVVRLRNEIAKLKQELMSMDGTRSPAAFKTLNAQLAASNQRLDELVTNAAKAGAEMETGFKRKIFDAGTVLYTGRIMYHNGENQWGNKRKDRRPCVRLGADIARCIYRE